MAESGPPSVSLLLALALGLLPGMGLAIEPPPLVFETPPHFAPLARRLQSLNPHAVRAAMELVGLQDSGPPIPVILAPEESEPARRTASWVAGYTIIPAGRIVLFPDRQVSYPHGSFEGLLLHELTHVFVLRVTGAHRAPRWFEEGLAMVAAQERTLDDQLWGYWIGLTAAPIPLQALDRLFGEDPPAVDKAYLLAEALVRYLIASQGPDAPRRILEERAHGVAFAEAVQRATGQRLPHLEREFWAQHTSWGRWVPVVTSTAVLWAVIVLLVWIAWHKQRQRAALVQRQWEEDEEREP
jgi:hypothetical protein